MTTEPKSGKPRALLSALWRRKTLAILLVALVCILFYFLLFRIDRIADLWNTVTGALTPIFIGLVLAYLLNPFANFLQRHFTAWFGRKLQPARAKKLASGLSITLSLLLVIVLIAALALMIIPEIVNSVGRVAESLPAQAEDAFNWVQTHLNSDAAWAVQVRELLDKGLDMLVDWLKNANLSDTAATVLDYVTTGVVGVVKGIFNLLVALVVTVYVLKDREQFLRQSKKLLCAFCPTKHISGVMTTVRRAHKIFGGYLVGTIIDSLLVGVLCFIGLSILRIPYALLVSVIICLTNVIPYFGPFIGAIPSAALILLADMQKGLIFIIFIIVLQQIDGNILVPRILGESTGTSAFWATFALLFFGGLFGMTGMIVGVPLFAVLYYLVTLWVNKRLQKRNLPTDNAPYETMTDFADGVPITEAPPPAPPAVEGTDAQ
ncbi:MAG: AI-2E family transporter [Clostridia bacterium]|nr:AI-2E family transporter [Clostridia bacterium]